MYKLLGSLLHFDDHQVNDLYFLEPEWLAKHMAQFIRPNTTAINGILIITIIIDIHAWVNKTAGILTLDSICTQFASDDHGLKEELKYLLEKFEVAFIIDDRHMIVPSIMSEVKCFNFEPPQCTAYPHLRRFWLSDYIPDGFWPRLICRIVKDHHIAKVQHNDM